MTVPLIEDCDCTFGGVACDSCAVEVFPLAFREPVSVLFEELVKVFYSSSLEGKD
jgi:hypothetical protein